MSTEYRHLLPILSDLIRQLNETDFFDDLQCDYCCHPNTVNDFIDAIEQMRNNVASLDQIETGLDIWKTVSSHIKSGVPVEGLQVIAQQNIDALRKLI